MLDTSSTLFHLGKQNVLKYCNEQLEFNIDSTATWYSCREYFEPNSYNTKKENRLYKRKGLKYEFFLYFEVNASTLYRTSYYLHTLMQVQYASVWLFDQGADQVWDIAPWPSIQDDLAAEHSAYVDPIASVELEFSDEYGEYVYLITQETTDATPIERVSEFSKRWSVNRLILSALTGEVFEETQLRYRSMQSPSW